MPSCFESAVSIYLPPLEGILPEFQFQGNFTEGQLATAINQWTMSNMRHLEVKAQMMEDFAREALVYVHPQRPEEFYQDIAAVTKKEVSALVAKMINSSIPAISILGERYAKYL